MALSPFEVEWEKRNRFCAGDLVFYNYWAYPKNCPGTVAGFGKRWDWMRIKFDHLKTVRSVPVYDAFGWHLSPCPLNDATIRGQKLDGRWWA